MTVLEKAHVQSRLRFGKPQEYPQLHAIQRGEILNKNFRILQKIYGLLLQAPKPVASPGTARLISRNGTTNVDYLSERKGWSNTAGARGCSKNRDGGFNEVLLCRCRQPFYTLKQLSAFPRQTAILGRGRSRLSARLRFNMLQLFQAIRLDWENGGGFRLAQVIWRQPYGAGSGRRDAKAAADGKATAAPSWELITSENVSPSSKQETRLALCNPNFCKPELPTNLCRALERRV